MINLNISSDSDYWFTEPFSPQKLSGKGVGPTSDEKILRAEDLMFIFESIKEFHWYNNEGIHWAPSFSSRGQYPSHDSYARGILLRPNNTSISTSSIAKVNGPGDPYWFDYNANFSALQSEHTTLPDLYVLFGMSSDKCYHISVLWYDYINTLYASTSLSRKILNLYSIHRFYKAIPMLHSMWIRVSARSSVETITTETTKHKGGTTISYKYFKNRDGSDTAHIESFIYPDISDYPSSEQSSTSTATGTPSSITEIYYFSGKTSSTKESAELAHRGQGEYNYIDDGYYSASGTAYEYSYEMREKSANSTVIFELWPANANYSMTSYKVFARISHELEITKSGHWGSATLSSYTKYKLVDISSIFSVVTESGKICLKASIDPDTFTDKMKDVQDYGSMNYPDDPILPTPLDGNQYKNTKTFKSKMNLIDVFAVVKPNFHATYQNEQVSPISDFMV